MTALATIIPFFTVIAAVSWIALTLNRKLVEYRKQYVQREEKTRKFLDYVKNIESSKKTSDG